MKQIKNITLAVLSGLLILSVATVSCKKKSSGPATPTVGTIAPSSADTVGQVITITGTNFTSSSTVTVGGVNATPVTFTSSTSISVTIPAGVANGTAVAVVVSNGSASSSPSNITVVPGAGAFTIGGKNSSNQVETSNLLAHWTFEGSTDEILSSSPVASSGGTITYVPGRIGQAVHLANGWLSYPSTAVGTGFDNSGLGYNSNDTLQNGYSISLWVQVPDTNLLTSLFQLNTPAVSNWPIAGLNYRKHADSTFDLDGGVTNVDGTGTHPTYGDAFATTTFKDNDASGWAFVVVTYDTSGAGHHFIYYANGVKVGASVDLTTTASVAFPDPSASLLMVTPNYATIGTFESSTTIPSGSGTIPGFMSAGITGNLDDIRFFKVTLSATDVDQLYQLGAHGQ
jgi:hypothetical protein